MGPKVEAAARFVERTGKRAVIGGLDQITDLVERIATGVRARKPKVLVSAAVFANDEDALARRFQPVFVSETTVEDTISTLRGLKSK